MCGRYQLKVSSEKLQQFLPGFELSDHTPRFNIAPTQSAPIIRLEDGRVVYRAIRFGLIPSWAPQPPMPPLINARSESVFEKPSFRSSIQYQRCLVPATGFYEWKKSDSSKGAYLVNRSDTPLFAFAGIWARWQSVGERIDSFAILTRAAGQKMSKIHQRVPVKLTPEQAELWLNPETSKFAIESIVNTADDDAWSTTPVSERVNNVRFDDEACETPRPVQQSLL